MLGKIIIGAALLTIIALYSEFVAHGIATEKLLVTESVKKQATSSLQADITNNPLSPPDTSSPRATLFSFLENSYKAYQLLMTAHQKNMEAPGVFTPAAIKQMGETAELYFKRAVNCLDLSEVSESLRLQ